METVVVQAGELHGLAVRVARAVGAGERVADGLATHLVRAELTGVQTHGIYHIPSTWTRSATASCCRPPSRANSSAPPAAC